MDFNGVWSAPFTPDISKALGHQPPFTPYGAARFANECDVIDIGRAVGPLERTGKRCHARFRVEGKRVARAALVKRIRQIEQLRRVESPVVQRALQRRHDRVGNGRRAQISRYNDQLAVARTVLQRGKFHKAFLRLVTMEEIYFTMVNRVGAVLGRFGLRRWNIAAFAGSFLWLVDVRFERR